VNEQGDSMEDLSITYSLPQAYVSQLVKQLGLPRAREVREEEEEEEEGDRGKDCSGRG